MTAVPSDDTTDGRAANSARSKQRLLDAAIAEFADHGFAGARVAAIAERAGVNKQLISYHFGGKQGLYDALQSRWLEREQELRHDDPTLPELAVRYLKQAITHPEAVRLAARQALDGTFPATIEDRADLDDLRRRQQRGEIAADLDPAVVLLALTGMVTAPILNGGAGGQLDNDDLDHYADQLARIVRRLAEPTQPPQPY